MTQQEIQISLPLTHRIGAESDFVAADKPTWRAEEEGAKLVGPPSPAVVLCIPRKRVQLAQDGALDLRVEGDGVESRWVGEGLRVPQTPALASHGEVAARIGVHLRGKHVELISKCCGRREPEFRMLDR